MKIGSLAWATLCAAPLLLCTQAQAEAGSGSSPTRLRVEQMDTVTAGGSGWSKRLAGTHWRPTSSKDEKKLKIKIVGPKGRVKFYRTVHVARGSWSKDFDFADRYLVVTKSNGKTTITVIGFGSFTVPGSGTGNNGADGRDGRDGGDGGDGGHGGDGGAGGAGGAGGGNAIIRN